MGLPIFAGVLAVIGLGVLWRIDVIRPGSLARAGHPGPEPASALPLALLTLGVYLLPVVLTSVAIGVLGIRIEEEPTLRGTGLLTALSYGAGLLVAITGCWYAARATLLRPETLVPLPRDAWVGLLGFALAYPTMLVVAHTARFVMISAGGDPGGELQHGTLELLTAGDRASPWWWVVLAGAVLGAPIVEEVVFRGLLQPAIRAAAGRWAGVLISAALFTLLHVPSGKGDGGATWLAIPTLAVLALALGITRERTGRLGVPIVMHIAFNALNVGLAFAVTMETRVGS